MTPTERAVKVLSSSYSHYEREWLIPAIADAICEAESEDRAKERQSCAAIAKRHAKHYGKGEDQVETCDYVAQEIIARGKSLPITRFMN